MSKLTKNQKLVADKIEAGKAYSLKEASQLVKVITTTKFDASVRVKLRGFFACVLRMLKLLLRKQALTM